jgi:hypothetical protein
MRIWLIGLAVFLASSVVGSAAAAPTGVTPSSRLLLPPSRPVIRNQTGNCAPSPSGSGILADGDFSAAPDPGQGEIGLRKGTEFAPDWIVSGPKTIDFYGPENPFWQAPNGVCNVDLDGTPGPGGIAHSAFATTKGAAYTVTFMLSGNGACAPTVKTVIVKTYGDQFATFTWDTSNGHDAQHGFWSPETWGFTAVRPLMKVVFASQDSPKGNCGAVIAAISVTKSRPAYSASIR